MSYYDEGEAVRALREAKAAADRLNQPQLVINDFHQWALEYLNREGVVGVSVKTEEAGAGAYRISIESPFSGRSDVYTADSRSLPPGNPQSWIHNAYRFVMEAANDCKIGKKGVRSSPASAGAKNEDHSGPEMPAFDTVMCTTSEGSFCVACGRFVGIDSSGKNLKRICGVVDESGEYYRLGGVGYE